MEEQAEAYAFVRVRDKAEGEKNGGIPPFASD